MIIFRLSRFCLLGAAVVFSLLITSCGKEDEGGSGATVKVVEMPNPSVSWLRDQLAQLKLIDPNDFVGAYPIVENVVGYLEGEVGDGIPRESVVDVIRFLGEVDRNRALFLLRQIEDKDLLALLVDSVDLQLFNSAKDVYIYLHEIAMSLDPQDSIGFFEKTNSFIDNGDKDAVRFFVRLLGHSGASKFEFVSQSHRNMHVSLMCHRDHNVIDSYSEFYSQKFDSAFYRAVFDSLIARAEGDPFGAQLSLRGLFGPEAGREAIVAWRDAFGSLPSTEIPESDLKRIMQSFEIPILKDG